jgi:hypothetical protein
MERARGSKTPYALSLPLLPHTSVGWPPTYVSVTVSEAQRHLATSIIHHLFLSFRQACGNTVIHFIHGLQLNFHVLCVSLQKKHEACVKYCSNLTMIRRQQTCRSFFQI